MVVATQCLTEARFSEEGETVSRRTEAVECERGSRGGEPLGRKTERGNQEKPKWVSGQVTWRRNGAQRAGRRHTVLLIYWSLLAVPGSVCPFRKRFTIPWKWDVILLDVFSLLFPKKRRKSSMEKSNKDNIRWTYQWQRIVSW